MKKSLKGTIILLTTGSVAWLLLKPSRIEVETALVEKGPVVETLSTDGYFRSEDRRTLSAFADGEIETLLLKPGDPVKKGQTLTRILWDVSPEPVRSPMNGVVSRVWRETAGPVRRGEPLLEVIDPVRLEVVGEILTTDASRIRPGQSALVRGFGSTVDLRARVKRLSRAAFVKVSALGVDEERTEVVLAPVEKPSVLAPWTGNLFHAEISIQTARVEKALKVPIGALIRSGGNWSVFAVKDRRAHSVPVARGIDDGHWVEILEGLGPGDRVILYPGDRIRPGSRIRLVESLNPPVR
jgi:HlyD family secretion protein